MFLRSTSLTGMVAAASQVCFMVEGMGVSVCASCFGGVGVVSVCAAVLHPVYCGVSRREFSGKDGRAHAKRIISPSQDVVWAFALHACTRSLNLYILFFVEKGVDKGMPDVRFCTERTCSETVTEAKDLHLC